MSKLKIIISSYDDLKNPWYGGGGAVAVHQVARRLVEKFRVKVITGKYPGCRNEVKDGVKYFRVGTKYFGPRIGQLVFQLCLPYLVRKEKYDVWMESFTPPFSTNFLQLFTKKPVIGVVHMLSGEDMRRKYKLPFEWIERLGLHFYKTIVVTSESYKNKILQMSPGSRVVVIPNGIEKTQTGKIKGEYILFVGRLDIEQKGLDLLLRAYSKVGEEIKYPLLIAGSGEKKEEKRLRDLIESLRMSDRVRILGKVTGREKEELFERAVFVVIPSRFETFSMVSLEALSFGKATLSFDIAGLEWLPDDCGVKVKGFNVAGFSRELLNLSLGQEKLDRLGEKGRVFAGGFSWESIADKYEALIDGLTPERVLTSPAAVPESFQGVVADG